MLWYLPILFILTIYKVLVFCFIITYNKTIEISVDKLANIRNILLSIFQLAFYLYRIKDIYFDFATLEQSAIQANIPNIIVVMTELKEKTCILISLLD